MIAARLLDDPAWLITPCCSSPHGHCGRRRRGSHGPGCRRPGDPGACSCQWSDADVWALWQSGRVTVATVLTGHLHRLRYVECP